jgi:hypothetical protein
MKPRRDLEPKRFLSGGTERAAAEWVKGIAIIQTDAIRSIQRLMGMRGKSARATMSATPKGFRVRAG